MQDQQLNPNFQLAVADFHKFAEGRISDLQMGFDGKRFTDGAVQIAFEAFQAARVPVDSGQLFARIREDSKYHHQIAWCISNGIGHPFPVHFRASLDPYVLVGGAGGAYRLADIDLFVLHEGELYSVARGGKVDE